MRLLSVVIDESIVHSPWKDRILGCSVIKGLLKNSSEKYTRKEETKKMGAREADPAGGKAGAPGWCPRQD